MRLVDIPYAPCRLFIYTDRDAFDNKVRFQYPQWEGDADSDGMNFQNHIFVEDIDCKETLLHEIAHFLEWLFEYMQIEKESEFKACITTHVILECVKL